jgi:TfoX/Sxy family transcriptional regulator of competence genes
MFGGEGIHAGDKMMALPYHAAPERLFDDPEEFSGWARKAHAAAIAGKARAKKRR